MATQIVTRYIAVDDAAVARAGAGAEAPSEAAHEQRVFTPIVVALLRLVGALPLPLVRACRRTRFAPLMVVSAVWRLQRVVLPAAHVPRDVLLARRAGGACGAAARAHHDVRAARVMGVRSPRRGSVLCS